ncbi:MAG: hypothetical protein R3B96_06810 [Pirellulaceae bacterium]
MLVDDSRQVRRGTWETMVRVLRAGTMPPEDADQPDDEAKQVITDGIEHY